LDCKLLESLVYFDNQCMWFQLLHGGLTDQSPEWLHEVAADDIIFEAP
jgi:hypothetical protein